jgi:hypothetical protein
VDVRSLVVVKVLDPGEDPPVNCVAAGQYYIMPASLQAFMEVEIVAILIIGELDRLDAAENGTARNDLATWAAGRFFLKLIIRAEASGAKSGAAKDFGFMGSGAKYYARQ